MRRVYEVTFTLTLTEVVEADSIEDAEQAFSELFTAQDLLEYGEFTVTETNEIVE